MKRSLAASAVAIVLGTAPALEAGTAGLAGVWSGEYIFGFCSACGGSPRGINIGLATPPQRWVFDFDAGTADITNTATFYGSAWTAHDVIFFDAGNGTYSGSLLWDWDVYTNIAIDVIWDIADSGQVTPVYALIPASSPVLPGFTPVFTGSISQVPIPAATWLFGSGLLGLVGVARRRSKTA